MWSHPSCLPDGDEGEGETPSFLASATPVVGEGADLPLPASALRKVNPAPRLGSTGVQMNHPEDMSMVNLALPLIWVMTVWVVERCHLPTPLSPVIGK